ncbi:hypothetical protein BS78_03G066500 [Paspalum vaginatum]|nr:hypothetical protein BS78_03G066500 [Paspalum vaginatum]
MAAASSPHAVSSVAAAASSPAVSSTAVSCAHQLGARWWHPPRRRAGRGPRPPARQAVRRRWGKHDELNGGDVLTAQRWRQLACGPTPHCGAGGSSAAAPHLPAVRLRPGSALLSGPAPLRERSAHGPSERRREWRGLAGSAVVRERSRAPPEQRHLRAWQVGGYLGHFLTLLFWRPQP